MSCHRFAALFCTLLAVGAVGCQQQGPGFSFAPAEGVVTKDGKPLEGVSVIFYPEPETPGPRSVSSPTDAAGHFHLHADDGTEGAVVGKHRVCIFDSRAVVGSIARLKRKSLATAKAKIESDRNSDAAKALAKMFAPMPRVPVSYGRPTETPLRAQVRAEPQVIDLEVK